MKKHKVKRPKNILFFRYKREEIRIQAWESQEKAKLEAEMRRIEVCVIRFRINLNVLITHTICHYC